MNKTAFWKNSFPLCLLFATALSSCSSDNDNGSTVTTNNPATYIKDAAKLKMIHSLTDIDGGKGRFYELNYTLDYKLDEALKSEPIDLEGITAFMSKHLFDTVPPTTTKLGYGAGCSAFAAPDPSTGNYLMGRNFDFCHVDPATKQEVPIAAIVVHTTSAEGKKSVSMVDSYWIGLSKGFYTDGKSDLSVLMALPYVFMDGMNEDGLAIGVLHLGGEPAVQKKPGKLSIMTSMAMRMLLDKAKDVDDAIGKLQEYNMNMESVSGGSYHYFMADAKGNYAIIEYLPSDTDADDYEMKVLNNNDTLRYVTNFYVHPSLANDSVIGGRATRGKERYNTMKNCMKMNVYKLTEAQAMELLGKVATDANPEENTSHTQWSSLYNLSKRTLDVSILKEYDTKYTFRLK
jgi:hypothetical protein